jgi:hypothetical protein
MESLEQELMIMLRQLPVPISITWRSGQYRWESAQRTGEAPHLITTVEEALRFLLSNPGAWLGIGESKKDQGDPDANP